MDAQESFSYYRTLSWGYMGRAWHVSKAHVSGNESTTGWGSLWGNGEMVGVSQKGVALYGVRLSPTRRMVLVVEVGHPCDAKVISDQADWKEGIGFRRG
jgi:hypothetical protein